MGWFTLTLGKARFNSTFVTLLQAKSEIFVMILLHCTLLKRSPLIGHVYLQLLKSCLYMSQFKVKDIQEPNLIISQRLKVQVPKKKIQVNKTIN